MPVMSISGENGGPPTIACASTAKFLTSCVVTEAQREMISPIPVAVLSSALMLRK